MYGLLTALHLIVCFALVISVLLQSGKGGGLAGAFGGGGGATGQTIFGGRGAATFLSKATTALGALFLLTALLLAMIPRGAQGPARSLIQEQAQETQATQPVDAAAPPGAFQDLPGGEGALPQGETLAPAEGTPAQGEGSTDDAQPTPPGSPTDDTQEDSGGGQ
jgi:preprotein translocase subunit SecG